MSSGRVRGHDDVLARFRRVLARGRLAHAYLFVGPEGIGKKLFALNLAKAILCEGERADPLKACGHCPACVQVDAGTHPDFQLASLPAEAHEFPVEMIQEIIQRLALKPARGRRRVAIIDDADTFSDAASNCFLKTLEEPPPDSLLILIGASSDRFFATITSRCQIIRFAPLASSLAAELLREEGIVTKPDDALRIAALAGGNLALAKTLADPEILKLRTQLLGILARPRLDGVTLAKDVNAWAEGSKDSAEKRRRASVSIGFLVEALSAALADKAGPERSSVPTTDQATIRALVANHSEDRLLRMLERCLEADRQIDRRVQLVLVVEALGDALAAI